MLAADRFPRLDAIAKALPEDVGGSGGALAGGVVTNDCSRCGHGVSPSMQYPGWF
jgi:hypothetical protein